MKNFNFKKYLFAVIAVYVVYEIMDFLIHGVILMKTYESMSDSGLWREDMESKMWVMYITALFFSIFFVYLYHFFTNGYGKNDWKSGLYFGLVVGFLMNVVGMFNQYAVYNVTLDLTWQWFFFGLVEIAICGLIAGLIYKPLEIK
jgi:hypothetical protein